MTQYQIKKEKNGYVLLSETNKEVMHFKDLSEAIDYVEFLKREENCEVEFKK